MDKTINLTAAAMGISSSAREDVYSFFSEAFRNFNEIHHNATQVALSKGTFARPPSIPTPKEGDFVKSKNFLKGWLGERRLLLAQEITHLFAEDGTNIMIKNGWMEEPPRMVDREELAD